MIWAVASLFAFLIQVAYLTILRKGFERSHDAAEGSTTHPAVSIVVAARNEEANIGRLLDALLAQTIDEFEVVVVDDASEDRTADIVRAYAEVHSHVRLVQVADPVPPRKKNALTVGIREAAHGVILLTDADCVPPPAWAIAMVKLIGSEDDRLVVGYSPFRREPSLINKLARYETFVTGFFTAGAIGLGRPYMAVGRNMAYPKSVFESVDGFSHSLHSLSGDDDLFVQQVFAQRAANVVHAFAPESFVPTDAPQTWREWVRQKIRHTSAARYYRPDFKTHLGLFHSTNAFLWIAPLLAGGSGVTFLVVKLAFQWFVLRRAALIFHERDLIALQPLLELLYTLYNLVIAPIGLLRMPRRW